MSRILLSLIFCGLLFCCPSFAAPNSEYQIEKWTTEQGLPQNTIAAIVQTRDGYLWLGTYGGLARFDGIKFTVFNTANTPMLKNQRINALYEDKGGTLWIGSDSGDVYKYRNGQFSIFKAASGISDPIYSMLVDSRGFLWVGGRNLVKYAFDDKGIIKSETIEIAPRREVQHIETIRGICEDSLGNIWFSAINRLFRYQNDSLTEFTGDASISELLRETEIIKYNTNLIVDRHGILRFASKKGIARFDGNRFVTEFSNESFKDGLPHFSEDAEGNLSVNFR
ncbi:MAG: two-component regulator propeller domain-containing protein, partial [Acidobacteriota bacterium]